jgi:hypothetical protein
MAELNNFLPTDNSIVNISRLLAVIISNNPQTKGHSDTVCQIWLDNGVTIPVTRQVAQELIAACQAGWQLPESSRAQCEFVGADFSAN